MSHFLNICKLRCDIVTLNRDFNILLHEFVLFFLQICKIFRIFAPKIITL